MQDVEFQEEQGLELDPRVLLAIVKRRKWLILVPAVLGIVATIAIAVLWPPTYRSEATILIEQPEVPPDLVSSTVTSYAGQRIEVIKQRALATDHIVELINKFDLYPEARKRAPISEVVVKVREDIDVELLSAKITDPRSGRPKEANIAFSVAYQYSNPAIAQKVANELVSFYLSQNLKARQGQATETAAFVNAQATALQQQLAELEAKMAALKKQNTGSLPEQQDYNRDLLRRAEGTLRDLDFRETLLREQKARLQSELAYVNPYGPYVLKGEQVLSPGDQLKALEMKRSTLSARYQPQHPEMMMLSEQIASLKAQTQRGKAAASVGAEGQKDAAGKPLDGAANAQSRTNRGADGFAQAPDNPRYIQLKSQLDLINPELAGVDRRRGELQAEIKAVQERLAKTPVIEAEYARLAHALDNTQEDYRQIRGKQLTAQLGKSMETERKGEKFSVIDPPRVPSEPEKPKRLVIVAAGLVLSLGAGLGTALLAELVDPAVRGAKKLAAITGTSPLVVVPYIRTRAETWSSRRRWALAALMFIAAVAGAAGYVHLKVMPLDIAWITLERQLEARLGELIP